MCSCSLWLVLASHQVCEGLRLAVRKDPRRQAMEGIMEDSLALLMQLYRPRELVYLRGSTGECSAYIRGVELTRFSTTTTRGTCEI
jgi:hypothetical protein